MRRTRLVESRAVFLAYVLAKCNFSTIEGLHRRFPLIWKKRDQYKYYKHVCLERTTFKEEYQLKCAYCLFEEASDDLAIFNALFEELYKQYKELYKELKKQYLHQKTITTSHLEKLINQENQSDQEYLIFLSVTDFFLEKLEVQMSDDDLFNQLMKQSAQLQRKLLDFEDELETYDYLKHQLNISNSIPFKKIKHFCRSYSDYLGRNVVDVLNERLDNVLKTSTSYFNIQWMIELGLIDPNRSYRLTTTDIYQLVALLLCLKEEESVEEVDCIKMGDYELPVSVFEAFEQSLQDVLPYFILSQMMKENRDLFFQSYTLKDEVISKHLEKELNGLKREVKSLKETNKNLKLALSKQKLAHEKAYKFQLKELQTSLILANQEKERLEKELVKQMTEYHQLKLKLDHEQALEEVETSCCEIMDIDVESINQAEIMIVGGAISTVQKLKKKLPNCKYYEVDKKYHDQYFKGVKLAILLTNILNHAMTMKLDKECPKAKKKSVTVTNVDLIIKEIAKFKLLDQ